MAGRLWGRAGVLRPQRRRFRSLVWAVEDSAWWGCRRGSATGGSVEE
jgi:hypothetical protein